MDGSEERRAALQEEFNKADRRLAELRYWHPMKAEIEACADEIKELQQEGRDKEAELKGVVQSIKMLEREGEHKRSMLEAEHNRKMEEAQTELEELEARLRETDEMLARWQGSLYEWLMANKPGWEDNIGKVVDEQNVLYAQGLNPKLSPEGSLFGIELNLEAIPAHHRTPDDFRATQQELRQKVEEKKKLVDSLISNYEAQLQTLRRSHHEKLKTLRQEETNLKVMIGQIPNKIKDAQTRQRKLESHEKAKIESEEQKRKAAYNDAGIALDKEKERHNQRKAQRDKELKAAESQYASAVKEQQKQYEALEAKVGQEISAKEDEVNERRAAIIRQERDELQGHGADIDAIGRCRREIDAVDKALKKIADNHHYVIEYRKDESELFGHEGEYRQEKAKLEKRDAEARLNYDNRRRQLEQQHAELGYALTQAKEQLKSMNEGLEQYDQLCKVENIVPDALLADDRTEKSAMKCGELVTQMRGAINRRRQKQDDLKRAVNSFNSHFGANNTFHFAVPHYDEDYLEFALNLQEFVENDKIEDYRQRVSDQYNTILRSVSREVGLLMNHSAEIKKIINELNNDFRERNFAGVIRSIELRAEESSDPMMTLLRSIRDFIDESSMSIGELNLFSGDDLDRVNEKVVTYLKRFMKQLHKEAGRTRLTLSDTFRLQFRIQENDNNTGWVERINNVGSDGADILVKAMVNIMLINVFKKKASRKNGDFVIHCMMDEIGKLHPSNVQGILQFANVRNIYLINSSPMSYNADIYRHNYLLTKDGKSQTHVKRLATINAI